MRRSEEVLDRIEHLDRLDGVAAKVAPVVERVTGRPGLRSLLAGTWLGHPLHPVLTDVPIGCWTSAFVLDLLAPRHGRRAAQFFIGLGLVSAVPTALTGSADWAGTEGPAKRVGLVHGLLNTTAVLTYFCSWRARRKGHYGRGVLLSLVGASAATGAAALGGHLVYRLGVGVDQHSFDHPSADWTDVSSVAPIDGGASVLRANGTSVVAARRASGWDAIDARCSHQGGPLDEGRISDGCVTCPWHASRFRLHDGGVVDGPAIAPQPTYDVREHEHAFAIRRIS